MTGDSASWEETVSNRATMGYGWEEILQAAFNQEVPIASPAERDEPLATSTAS